MICSPAARREVLVRDPRKNALRKAALARLPRRERQTEVEGVGKRAPSRLTTLPAIRMR